MQTYRFASHFMDLIVYQEAFSSRTRRQQFL
jgi:hypothetical protein